MRQNFCHMTVQLLPLVASTVQPPEFTLSLLYKQTWKKETTSIHIIDLS